MCRSIKTLRLTEGVASDEEIRAASLQFVRKVSGYRRPSKANEDAFNAAVEEIASVSRRLLTDLRPGARNLGAAAPSGRGRTPDVKRAVRS